MNEYTGFYKNPRRHLVLGSSALYGLSHLSAMTRDITKTITIAAPPAKVREVFFDFAKYPEWNPFFISFEVAKLVDSTNSSAIDGPAPGSQLKIAMTIDTSKSANTMYPTVLKNTAEEFRWKGKLVFDILFAGEHAFQFKPIEDGTKTELVQSEHFSGVLVPLTGGILDKTETRFDDLNVALKKRVEELVTQ
ncbi:uncharacterized protein V1518DRAFT_419599 [Limtongia smithiae]|uniref:uncharacterized protein n=1 Tax=Limtongia smithiae TaxID=1125753 RepID=UPI0034CDF14F